METISLLDILEQTASFSAKEKEMISKKLVFMEAQKGDFLLKANEICENVFFILEGIVRFYTQSDSENEVTSAFLSEGEIIIKPRSFLKQKPSLGYFQCETPCKLQKITYESWEYLCSKTKNFGYAMGQIGAIRLTEKLNMQRKLLTLEGKDAVIEFMNSNVNIVDRVALKHISSYLGITPSSLSRIKKLYLEKNKIDRREQQS